MASDVSERARAPNEIIKTDENKKIGNNNLLQNGGD